MLESDAEIPDEIRPSWCVYDPNVDNSIRLSDLHSIPAPLVKCLRPYRVDGIRFLYSLYSDPNIKGGLLADDMGLGKTAQAIGLLSALSKKTNIGVIDASQRAKKVRAHCLIISPASIIYNWQSEIQTWSYFSVAVYYGPNRRQDILYKSPDQYEIILTTYDILREEIDALSSILPWNIVILDEIHRLKDPKGRNHKILKSHLSTIPLKIGLSGTILQNKYQELWAILDWVNPGCLGTWKHFNEKYSKPIELGLRQNATSAQLAKARLLQKDFDDIKKRWVLRRVKKDKIVDLPSKVDKIIYCAPTPFQIALFRKLLSTPEMQQLWKKKDKKRPRKDESKRTSIFTFIQLFLKVANHVGLLSSKLNKSSKTQKEFSSRAVSSVISDFYSDLSSSSFLSLTDTKYSGKMVVLADLLSALKKEQGNKCLLFSYSTKVLDILEQFIKTRAYRYLRIDGETPAKCRFSIVKNFNDNLNTFILLLSTKAGGLGLNITGANVVIVYDPNWNPSHDLQAQDRAYRIGQTKDVRVFRLITSGCIEENIYLRQLYKQQLCRNAVDGEKVRRYFQGSPNFGKREVFGVKNLFTVKTGGISQTEAIFKRNKEMEQSFQSRRFKIVDFELDPKSNLEDDDPFLIDIDEEDSDDKIISNYRKKKPKTEIDAVLSSKNILRVHENKSVVGGSRIEEEVSECAIQEIKEQNPSSSAGSGIKSVIIPPLRHLRSYRDQIFCTKDGTIFYGQTPNAVKKRDFAAMASLSGLSEKDFAAKVVEMKPVELAKYLQNYYISSKKVPQAGHMFDTVIDGIEKEMKELMGPTPSKLNSNIVCKKRRKSPMNTKPKKRFALDSSRMADKKVLFPSDSFFDIGDQEQDCVPKTSGLMSILDKQNEIFSESFEEHFFDTNFKEMDAIFPSDLSKSNENLDQLPETQLDVSKIHTKIKSEVKPTSNDAIDEIDTLFSESLLSQRSPKPPPEGIFYKSKPKKCLPKDNTEISFYEDVMKSQSECSQKSKGSLAIELPERKNNAHVLINDDSQFFDSIFSLSTNKPSLIQEDAEADDALLTQWIKRGNIKKS